MQFIHSVLGHADRHGFRLLPLPIATKSGSTFVQEAGRLWELAPWLPGEPQRSYPLASERLEAALAALAAFHLAVVSYPLKQAGPAPSPGLIERRARLGRLLAGGLQTLWASVRPELWPEGAAVSRRLLELFASAAPQAAAWLARAAEQTAPLQPCLRDVWSDHVLFVGPEVSGLIDYGAMRVETVAGDVARLLGSYAGDEPELWQRGLDAYQRLRPLSPAELAQVNAFDRSTVLMAGLSWVEWIYHQRRVFHDLPAIRQRLERLAARLEWAEGNRQRDEG